MKTNLLEKFYKHFKNDTFLKVDNRYLQQDSFISLITPFFDNMTLWVSQPNSHVIKISDNNYISTFYSDILLKNSPNNAIWLITDDYIIQHSPQLTSAMKNNNIKVDERGFYILDNLKDFDITNHHLANYLHFLNMLYDTCQRLPDNREQLEKHLNKTSNLDKALIKRSDKKDAED